MNFLKINSLLGLLLLAACFPKEEAIPAVERVNLSQFVDAGEYKNTVTFYSLETSEIVAEADPMQWDLYIDNEVIRLNYFRSMRVAKVDKAWHEIEDTVGLDFVFLTDETFEGLTQWELDTNQIYVVEYGFDNDYNPMGLQVIRVERTEDAVRVWNTDIGVDYEVFTELNAQETYYNIREKKEVELPIEAEYDVAFGKYTEFITIDDESQDYNIYGAILGNALAYQVIEPFDSVGSEIFETARLLSNKNVIGWDWKTFRLDKNAYEIEENQTYLISSGAGFKYKLRFVNFYNFSGDSGHPTFEYSLL